MDSIGEQTYKDYEIVVVEEGLMAHNINEGIKRAKGDMIKLMCMDDFFAHPKALQKIADVEKGKWVATACTHVAAEDVMVADDLIKAGTRFNDHPAEWGDRMLQGYNTIGGLSVIAFPNDNPPQMDGSLSWLIDVDFYEQLKEKFGKPVILKDINVVIGVGFHQTTMLLTDERKLAEEALLRKKYNISLIKEAFIVRKTKPSDINEHMETLRRLSSKCKHITELGVGEMVSSWAFLEGLRAEGGKLVSIDIKSPTEYGVPLENIQEGCIKEGIEFVFRLESSLMIEIEETDMLFIDTLHTYKQVSQELKLHADKAKKYIVFHDTESCKEDLLRAVSEFLEVHPEWRETEHHTHNNGLTVLTRAIMVIKHNYGQR